MELPESYVSIEEKLALELRLFGALRFRSNENGNVRVGVFPEGEKILASSLGFHAVTLKGIGASESELCKRANESSSLT
jgi:hypothetical protein